jgi:c-di-GMP-binding flagellar brake protein YcgR
MALPRVGQIVYLDVRKEPLMGRYQCRVVDGDSTSFYIETPMRLNVSMPVAFNKGDEFEVVYRALDGAECRFPSKVLSRQIRDLPVLEIVKPKTSDITRIQRREYLRVPFSESVELSFIDTITKKTVHANVMTRDISGGGMALLANPDLPIRAEDVLSFTFRLPNEPQQVTGNGVVLRVFDLSDNLDKKLISIRFTEISEQNRQRIVRFTFARQIEIRKKLGE